MLQKTAKFCILFRVDSNRKIGTGHLQRCLSLANEFKKKNIECLFVSKFNETINYAQKNNFHSFFLKRNENEEIFLKKLISQFNINAIIIDSKKLSLDTLVAKLFRIVYVFTIDSMFGHKFSDLVILPGLPEQFSKIPSNALLGKKYVILNSNIVKSTNKKIIPQIVISLGGSDKFNITEKIVKAFLKNSSKFKILIILGKYSTRVHFIQSLISNDKRFELKQDPKNYTDLVASSKFGIFSFGISVYEAAAMRLPLVVLSHSNENHKTAKNLEKYGWFKYVG